MENYRTTDLYFAAALLAKGFEIIEIYELVPGRKTFVFKFKKTSPEELLNKYYSKTLSVDCKTFVESIKDLKGRLYAV